MKFNHITSFLIVIVVFVSGCGVLNSGSGADKAFQLGEYHKAAEFYKKLYSKEKNKYTKGEISFKMGECYRKINYPTKAASAYSKAARSNYDNPLALLYMGQSYLKVGDVDKAKEAFEAYLIDHPSDIMAQEGLKSCELVISEPKPSRFEVEPIKAFKSKYSDFSPAFGGTENDIVYFASMRHEGKRKGASRITGQGVSNIYSTRPNSKGKWMDPEAMEEPINSQYDEGAICMSKNGSTMYFTRCRFDRTKELGGEICTIKRSGGMWGEPEVLPLGGDSILFAHPAINNDESVLYFVSDMEGGFGGLDIWKVEKGGEGGWGEPENMGALINTAGDEMFPTVNDDVLYFSSTGHAGYGGLDIFKVLIDKNEDTGEEKMHLKLLERPINSQADDFGMVYRPESNEGMFVSSRDNAKGNDNIFKFVYYPITYSLNGKIFDSKTGNPLTDSYVKIVGSDGTMEKIDILPDATFTYPLKNGVDYVFLVASKGYLNQKVNFTTIGLDDDKEFSYDLAMISKSMPVVMDDISYDAGKYEITTKIAASLDRLLNMLLDNPTVTIEITSHTAAEGDETQNIILSQKRAEAIINYLFKKGIPVERVVAKGVGDSQPLMVDKKLAKTYKFIKEGDILTNEYISELKGKNKDIAIGLNRRTEFRVLSE
ncbi:MAG: OmpA family protein [Bacteroidales bacterium]|nr:OmpA family protein [Bacteroidales bacterium]